MESPCASIESKSSSHQEVAELYFPDYAAHTFAVNRSGNNAVLVVQKLLAVVDLESGAQKAFRKLNAQGGAGRDVRAVEWGPHAENANLIASAFQNQVDIWDLESERAGSPKLTLKAHTKPTYGLNWSRFDPNVIATCAADSFVYIWDLREFRKPQDKFKVTVSGASVVQWNRLNSQLLASVHDCDVRIWDRRKPTSAVGYISAHFGKVNWLDWSHEDERRLVTCSQDSSMKVWSTQQPRSPLNILKPWPQPALRALFTPFGEGMVGCCAPSLHVNADPNIWLWNSRTDSAPSYCFSGSQEATHEMKWLLPSKDKKARLATWSKVERKLRIWTVPKEVEETCKKDKSIEAELESAMSQTSLSSNVSTLSGAVGKISYTEPLPISPQRQQQQQQQHSVSVGMLTSPMSVSSHSLGYSSSSLHTLEKEFSLVDADIPNVTIEDRDHAKRTCHVKCISGLKQVVLVISFPSFYPNDAPPSFTINNLTSNIDQASQQSVLISLNDVAHAAVKENKPCLQLCLKKLSSLVDALQYKLDMPKASMSYPSPLNPYRKDSRVLSTFADDSIPFPRTNGARFCGNGKLIVFMRPQKLALVSVEGQKTPKSMSEVTTLKSVKIASRGPASRQSLPPSRTSSSPMVSAHAFAVPPPSKAPQATSIMPYIVKAKQSRTSLGNGSSVHSDASQSNPYVGVISISNAESLLPFSLELAKSCKLTTQTIDLFCEQNKDLAQRCGRPDLVRTWLLVKLATSVKNVPPPLSPDEGLPWSAHPLGRRLVESLLEHYWSLHDVQTVAILSCALQMYDALVQSVISKERGEQVLMPYEHSRPSQLPFGNPLSISSPGSPPMENRQMWGALAGRKSYFLHDFSFEGEEQFLDEGQEHLNNCLLLSEDMARRCAEARRSYGNILERYQLLMQKTEVLKYQPMKEPDHIGIEFSNVCQHCGHTTRGPKCHCQKMAFDCVVCHTAVRGLSNFCLRCGHGGHAIHLQNWFSLNSVCASGCGCRCLEKSLSML